MVKIETKHSDLVRMKHSPPNYYFFTFQCAKIFEKYCFCFDWTLILFFHFPELPANHNTIFSPSSRQQLLAPVTAQGTTQRCSAPRRIRSSARHGSSFLICFVKWPVSLHPSGNNDLSINPQ